MLRSENILKTIVTSLTVNKDQKKNVAPIRNCHWLKNVFLKYYLTLSFFALLIQALRHNMMHDLRDYCLWSGLYPLLALSLPLLDNCLCLTIAFAWQLLLLDNCLCVQNNEIACVCCSGCEQLQPAWRVIPIFFINPFSITLLRRGLWANVL